MQDISKTQSMQNDASIQPEQQITTSFTLFELSITNVAIFWGLIVILAEFLPHIKIFGWNVLPTSILSKIAMSRDSVVKYSFGWIPKFIKAWDSTSTTLFPAVESKKFCHLCIKMVVEFVSSFFELVLSVINLPSGVFVTGDFSKSGNNLREAGRHFWNFICTLLMIRHLIWFLGSFLIAMIVEAFRILFVYLSIFVVILVYAVYIVIFVYMKLLGLKPKLSAIRLRTSKDSTAKVADTGSNILPSDISNSKFYKQFLENYIKKAQDPLLLPWDFVNFWGATEPEKLKLSRQVVGELRDRGLFNSEDSFMHKKLKHHARNHFIVDSRFFLILEASYSYLRELASLSSTTPFGIDVEKLRRILIYMKYKDVSDIDKILKDVSIFLKGHVSFEGLFTVNREMYYKLVAFLKIYTLWEFIKVNKADAFISEDSNTEHSISYSSSIDNRLMSEEEKMNQMAAYTEKCEEEMESLNDFISKDELNEISEQYLLKALNLKVFEIQEDNQTVSETPDNTNEEADQRRKLTILKRQEGEVTYFSKVLVEE